MTTQRSINQQLRRATTLQAKRQTVQTWAAEWQAEQLGLITNMETAMRAGDGHRTVTALSGLRAGSTRRFAALPAVLDALLAYEDETSPAKPEESA